MGLSTLGSQLDLSYPYTGCRLCGALFQTPQDRTAKTAQQQLAAYLNRRDWSHKHARTHPQHMHDQLERSGAYMTPEAAHKLASCGVISVGDMALSDEHWHAGFEAARKPSDDPEGT